jgi:leader peptidase (prepilin peptidase)/N-methyltransferase
VSARILYEAIGFLVGLIFGSFLNVCISRLPKHESIVRPGSHCPTCSASIRWYDNIPVLSWLLLRGRCRSCGQAISTRYPIVELITAAWFTVQAARLHTVINFYFVDATRSSGAYASFAIISNIALTVAGVFLIGLLFMDWETGLLPDSFTIPGILTGILFVCAQAIFLAPGQGQILLTRHSPKLTSVGATRDAGNVFMTGPEAVIMARVLAACGAALLMLLIRQAYKALRHRDGMGLGDVKLLAMITAFMGFWPGILSLFFGVLGAMVYGIVLVTRGRASSSSKLAFGSFLAAGALVTAQVGDRIIEAYSQLLR